MKYGFKSEGSLDQIYIHAEYYFERDSVGLVILNNNEYIV